MAISLKKVALRLDIGVLVKGKVLGPKVGGIYGGLA
jgi:hypothetical protein